MILLMQQMFYILPMNMLDVRHMKVVGHKEYFVVMIIDTQAKDVKRSMMVDCFERQCKCNSLGNPCHLPFERCQFDPFDKRHSNLLKRSHLKYAKFWGQESKPGLNPVSSGFQNPWLSHTIAHLTKHGLS
jgi:hypothetical protein